jgi:membrane protease YdiL (CAAX protease family)
MAITAASGSTTHAAHREQPVRRWVAAHPLGTFTAAALGLGWPVLAVPALAEQGVLAGGKLPVEPFVLAAVWLVMLPAALGVTAAVDGRAGVRALLRRAVHWRFGARWWAAALVALPAAALAIGLAAGRTLQMDEAGAAALTALVSIPSALILVNLWKETVWAGFLQTRLQQRHGFWRASLLTAAAFAAIHVPL